MSLFEYKLFNIKNRLFYEVTKTCFTSYSDREQYKTSFGKIEIAAFYSDMNATSMSIGKSAVILSNGDWARNISIYVQNINRPNYIDLDNDFQAIEAIEIIHKAIYHYIIKRQCDCVIIEYEPFTYKATIK